MRYFGRGFDTCEDDEAARLWRAYRENYRRIVDRLPAGCTVLDALSLHDAIIMAIRADDRDRIICCVAGDLQRGYYAVDMRHVLAPAARMPDTDGLSGDEVLRDEFDMAGAHFVHRLRFASGAEIEIPFADLIVRCARVADRNGTPAKD